MFDPDAAISRAEFAVIAARFFDKDGIEEIEEDLFPDIQNHWARREINVAAKMGILLGYEDGTFRPNQSITRAEAMTIFNRILGRYPDKDHLLSDMRAWPDNMDPAVWYYADVQEATNSHDYTRPIDKSYEIWTRTRPSRNWSAMERPLMGDNNTPLADSPIPVKISEEKKSMAMVEVEDSDKPVISVELRKSQVKSLATAGKSLDIQLGRYGITFSSVVLSAIAEQAREDTIVVALRMVPGMELNQFQQDALEVFGLHSLFSISVTGGGEIHDFQGGRATVRIPFVSAGGLDTGNFVVLYVADNGKVERVPFTYKHGIMEFSVSHFSQYAIASDDTGAAPLTGHLVYPFRIYLRVGLPCAAVVL